MNRPVSFSTAKLLKEKGFNIPCQYEYNNYNATLKKLTPMKEQTMSERKINLEEILNDCVYIDDEIKPMVKNAMKEACRQIIELAAENAKIINGFKSVKDYYGPEVKIIDKQSILDTIEQIE